MPVRWRAPRNRENARSALDCGGLTPPWNFGATTVRLRDCLPSAWCEGGVKPPHSKVPSAQAEQQIGFTSLDV